MKGSIGTATQLSYTRPYWGKVISRLNYIDKLSPKAKVRYKAINLYSSGDYWSEPLRLDTLSLNTPCIPENYPLPITSRIPPEADTPKRNATSFYYTHLQ